MVSLSPLFQIVIGTNVKFAGNDYIVKIGELKEGKGKIIIIDCATDQQYNVGYTATSHMHGLEFNDSELVGNDDVVKQDLTAKLTRSFHLGKVEAILSGVINEAARYQSPNPEINSLMQQVKKAASALNSGRIK